MKGNRMKMLKKKVKYQNYYEILFFIWNYYLYKKNNTETERDRVSEEQQKKDIIKIKMYYHKGVMCLPETE